MLEGLVATLLNRFLGMYVQNFDPKQLNVGIWSGDVVLRKMELRREALDQLHLPLNVVEGHVGILTLQIPWSNLKGKPVKVYIEDVFLLAAPKEDSEYDEEDEARRQHAVKMEKLDSAELIKERTGDGMTAEEQQKSQSFTESLVTKIVDNLQVTVKNIHIRYEDSISTPGHPFALGFTLEEFSAISTDGDWNPTFIQISEALTHKLATLEALTVYWDTDSPLFGASKAGVSDAGAVPDHDELMEGLRGMIVKSEGSGPGDHQFVLKPVNGKAKLVMSKTGKLDMPKLKATLLFDEIGFVLDEDQYRDALMMVDLFHHFILHQEYKKYQPKGVTPKEDPRAWLKFAVEAVIGKIHQRNRVWSWAYMKERRDDRIRYIDLFKKKKRSQAMTPEETDELTKLEWKLSYEDLRFWRSLARNQLRKEHASVKPVVEQPQKQGWIAWVWGSGKQDQKEEESTVMTDQQRKELYDAIEWDEKAALAEAIDMPRDSMKMQIEASLKTGSFTLKRDPHGKGKEIVSLLFDHFGAKVLQRPGSFLVDASLAGLRVYDGTTEGSLFPQIVSVKDAPVPSDERVEELYDDDNARSDDRVEKREEDPFFQLQFEQNPLDESADSAVTVKLKGMEVIYNPRFIVEIAKFFKPPERHMESIGALMESAGATVEAVRRQTRAGLEFALEEHKTINAKLDLQAPLVIIPESITDDNSNCLIVDAGHVSLISELVDKGTIKEIQSKQRQQYSEEDYRRLEGLMYDRFQLKLESTQVLIGPSISDTKAQLEKKDDARGFHIIDRINIDFIVEISILPKAPNLTKFRISGHLPLLHASVSDRKYKILMKLVDVAIPKFEDGPREPAKSKDSVKEIKDRPSSDDAVSRNTKGASRPSVFEFSTQAQSIIIDDEDDSTEGEEKLEVAPDGITDNLKLQQRTFELKFTVDKLQGSLFKSDPEGRDPDRLLVELVAEHFGLEFYLRQFDMGAEVVLRSLSVEDYIDENPTPGFKKIVSSETSNNDGRESDLFCVKYTKINQLSPEFMTTYEGIETNVDVSISTINVVVTRKTVLTLLDFVLVTFTNPDVPPPSGNTAARVDGIDEKQQQLEAPKGRADSGKIRVKVILKSIVLILNNDGMRLATLGLNTADVGIFLMGKTMRIGARLGNLNLIDDINQGASTKSPLRQLLTIEGDELADFRYETFDPEGGSSYPGYNSSIYLRSGSVKVNFVSEPFRKIIDFAVKFGKMQAIFNAARQAAMNQASQIQENAGKIHFDILVMTPIVVFPRVTVVDRPERDLITAYLGEIYANNRFIPAEDSSDSGSTNDISAGIRNIRLTSCFHFQNGESEELEMINKVDLGFKINYLDHKDGAERPDTEVEGSMSDFNLRITQTQMKFLLELSRSIPEAFALEADVDEEVVQELPSSTAKHATATKQDNEVGDESEEAVNLRPELGVGPENWTKLDLLFKIQKVGLDLLLAKDDEPVGNMEGATLSKFSLNDTSVKLRMISDGSVESEVLIDSFTSMDSRKQVSNKFRKVMSSVSKDVQQFMASITMSGGKERNLVAILTIDSPRIIFALDYLFALQDWLSAGFAVDEPLEVEAESEGDDESESTTSLQRPGNLSSLSRTNTSKSGGSGKSSASGSSTSGSMNIAFRVNVVDAQVILIANPTSTSSEAIVLSTKQVLLSQQHALALQITKVGMFLCRMDHFETSRLRILDDFGLNLSMDSRSQGPRASLTNVNIDIEPLVLRLSLRDILLALSIVNRASELSGRDEQKPKDPEPKRIKEIKGSSLRQRSASGRALTTTKATTKSVTTGRTTGPASRSQGSTTVAKREDLTAEIEGLRVILIGDLHELPLLDLSVKRFTVGARDWSGQMNADTNIETFINVYNFSKSAWEPLIEPWQLGFHMSRDQNPDRLSVEFFSRKMLEITITSATIALASKSAQFLSQDEDVLSKPRGVDTPYRIRNYTGFDLNIWADTSKENQPMAAKLADGEEAPWRFEEWERMRENLSPEGDAGMVGVRLAGSGFDSINKIPVNREGETLYNLRPTQDKVLHRLLVEVKLAVDNVKYITFRSPLLVENRTQIPVEIGVFSPEEGHLLKIEKILPGEERPAPVGAAFFHSLLVRPDQGFGYAWSNEQMFWKDLLRRPTRTITCRGESGDRTPPFYFQMHASYDKNDPLTSIYPYMRIRLSAPLELHNLLPYDFKYRVYDKNTKKDWTNFLRRGGLSPVHVVELSHLLLMSIHMQDTVFKQSEFAIINSSNHEDFRRETNMVVRDEEGLTLNLKLHYFNIPDSGGAFRVAVYSPYVILNKTGLDISIKSKSLLGQTRNAAGQGVLANSGGDSDTGKALPYMFSFPSDEHQNRAILKVGDSNWSRPQSLDAIGSNAEVVLPSATKQKEIHIGITIQEGEGKYKMTKVVTLAPRFILKNKLNEEISVREPESSNIMTLRPGQLLPLHFLRQAAQKRLCLCFPGMNNQWSSPFNISDLGSVHVKLTKAGQRQRLIRVEILIEQATIFLHLSIETNNWPFSIRNESDTEFIFYQTNPNTNDGENGNHRGWRPIRYRLPPRSIMPYAWDYPAAKDKDLVISANDKERNVRLAEIGNLIPMKIPVPNSHQQKIIDLNVVADGPTQTLVLSNYKPSRSLYKQKSRESSQASVSTGFEVKELDTDVNFKAQVRFTGVGISLINAGLRELAYITFRDIEVKYSESPLYQTINLTTKWIQIDNQLYGGIFPIILYPSVVPKTGKEMEIHPSFHAMITRVKDDSYGVLYIKYATVLLQQMTLEIDEDFIFALLDFSKIPGASWSEEHEGNLCDDRLDIPEPKQEQQGRDVYFELLNIQPAQMDLSFVRTERVNVEDKTTSRNPVMFFLNVLTMAIGNVNDAPVRLNALMLENARVSIPVLLQHIQNHYSQEFFYQVHKILGSADFLGNPVGLFNNISSGVADIFYEPYQGFVMTDRPQELGIGIAKGATSFVKKSVFGVTDSMSKVTGSISKGLAAATMDKQFQDRRRMSRSRNRPKHALYGVTAGANSFVTSLASGVGGLARKPIEGAEREGVTGFFKGVGKGVIGLATKPAIGVFDLASNVTEGIRNTTTVFDAEGLDRVRLTRFIGTDGIVRPYSQREALGQFWLKQLDNGKYFDENYLAHLELPGEDVVAMLTYKHIMLIKSKRLTSEWDVPLKDVQTISKERTGLSVTLRGGTSGPFIPIKEESARNFLYGKIGIAVRSFNAKYKATE
ncbi:hypothetical protein GP486_001757 [Trichoglossum hirsutum]|uniref:Vacuolar protein sorting-associated protein n=1 Tax=Trichoglossum hirsutum TaxID=265104 RepID=A0A9P8LGH9_9PEZI|nr:hypothetical protein GP486_001757 [Trichoglossum hirsutum]